MSERRERGERITLSETKEIRRENRRTEKTKKDGTTDQIEHRLVRGGQLTKSPEDTFQFPSSNGQRES